jgi:SsrA-binding protein
MIDSYVRMMPMESKIVAKNRKAEFEYFLLEHFEAGLALQGSEIKSVRAGQVSLQESYVQVDATSAWLVGAHIATYEAASYTNHDPKRSRQLLLHKKEIKQLWNAIRQKGVTIVPVRMYLKDGRAKLDIAVAKGKKLYDKREVIAKRDAEREIARVAGKRE